MSLFSMPFTGTNIDTVLHIVAGVVLIGTIAAIGIGFWKLHELPIHKASSSEHHQIGLITALTWIGFIWHWVWVLAVIIAFIDGEQALKRLRDIWHGDSLNTKTDGLDNDSSLAPQTKEEQTNA